jgi:hypothetical protein
MTAATQVLAYAGKRRQNRITKGIELSHTPPDRRLCLRFAISHALLASRQVKTKACSQPSANLNIAGRITLFDRNLMQQSLQHLLDSLIERYHPMWDGVDSVELNGRYGPFGETPLHIFAVRGDLESCERLVKAGAELDVQGEHNFSPLMEAVIQGHFTVAELLIRSGADTSISGDLGFGCAEVIAEHMSDDSNDSYSAILKLIQSESNI